MKITDIVNRNFVNLTNCDQEPIHIPGSIQPHGFLFALDNDRMVRYCSGNSADYIHISHEALLGKTFSSVFGAENDEKLTSYFASADWETGAPFYLSFNGKDLTCSVHISGDLFVIEAEKVTERMINAQDLYLQTRRFADYMQQSDTLQDLCRKVAGETRRITGYDRVMIYRFDPEYNGEVYAEACREDLEPFLGLHYPHTDIPAQARELYLRNLLRLIVDLRYTPVPVYTIGEGKAEHLDLSLSVLRSTSPIHVQYLQNMGVDATLTISLIHQGRLWGLIACHHYSPKYISPETRLAAKLQGHFLTSQIDVRQIAEEYEASKERNESVEKMMSASLTMEYDSFDQIISDPALLHLADASGAGIIINGKVYKTGKVPSDDLMREMAASFSAKSVHGYFYAQKLKDFFGDNEDQCETVAGVLYHALGKSGADCIMWFRQETREEVNWAGDPSRAIEKDEKGLSPRKSFETWKQIIKCQSREWLNPELNAAATYAHALRKHVNLLFLSEEERKYRALTEVLKETNAELENINWISTHDLQEPLRKIQMVSSMMLTRHEVSAPVEDAVNRINASANRMQTLLKDILSYTRFRHNDESLVPLELRDVIDEMLSELAEDISEKKAVIRIGDLPSVKGIAFLLKQVFLNIVRNALKFSEEGKIPEISIGCERVTEMIAESPKDFLRISITDNGIGFDQQYAQSIFNIFSRLHNQEEYAGSGVGLALCKKIMQNHGGFIKAESGKGKGATFFVYFPV